MANFFEYKDRRVVPNWRSFRKTTKLGELNSTRAPSEDAQSVFSLDNHFRDWTEYRTIAHAADLLSAVVANEVPSTARVEQVALFVLDNPKRATASQVNLARYVLDHKSDFEADVLPDDQQVPDQTRLIQKQEVIRKIRSIKKALRQYSRNAILYVELSRYYSIIGEERKSVKAMKVALQLAPLNRFVLRSATRLFAHYHSDENGYLRYIYRLLTNNEALVYDPWLMSAAISIATIQGFNSPLLKKGVDLVKSGNHDPFSLTELSSSIGTVELLHGSYRKSRPMFDKALIRPNDNSLAQIEWASSVDSRLSVNQEKYEVKLKFEARAVDYYYQGQFTDSLNNATKWLLDQPYSRRPVLFGYNIAACILQDHQRAISLVNAGLISHPYDAQLINNMAYSLALLGRADEAFEWLKRVKAVPSKSTEICLSATEGLVHFRLGWPDKGRSLYRTAIEQTRELGIELLNWTAILNYAREELLASKGLGFPVMDLVSHVPERSDHIALSILRSEVMDIYNRLAGR